MTRPTVTEQPSNGGQSIPTPPPSVRRFVVLGGPGGRLTVRPAGCPMLRDQYRRWTVLFTYNLPRRLVSRRLPNGRPLLDYVDHGRLVRYAQGVALRGWCVSDSGAAGLALLIVLALIVCGLVAAAQVIQSIPTLPGA